MNKVKNRIEALCQATGIAFECQVDIDYGSGYYQVFNTPEITADFLKFAEQDASTISIRCTQNNRKT